jgi:hypothetical protein
MSFKKSTKTLNRTKQFPYYAINKKQAPDKHQINKQVIAAMIHQTIGQCSNQSNHVDPPDMCH